MKARSYLSHYSNSPALYKFVNLILSQEFLPVN